jgi:hypothetical protein
MSRMRRLLTNRKSMAIAFIFLGVLVTAIYGLKSYRSYKQWNYIQEQGLDRGGASIEAIRPWMTIRYISVAYAVPQEYVFAKLDIPSSRRNSNEPIGLLSRDIEEEQGLDNAENPILVTKVANIILTYRENPVATGLNDIRSWMTLQYIANSTGIPVDYLFKRLNIDPGNGYEFKPLKDLAQKGQFPDGLSSLIVTLKESLATYEGSQ